MISILSSSCSKHYAKRQYSPAVSLELESYNYEMVINGFWHGDIYLKILLLHCNIVSRLTLWTDSLNSDSKEFQQYAQYQTKNTPLRKTKTDNTKAKRITIKGQTTIYKTLYRELQIEQHENHQVLRKCQQFLFHMWHSWCYSCYRPDDKSR